MRPWAALALCGALALSCSSGRTPPPATSEYYVHADQRKAEINALWMQIRQWRVDELGLSANPASTELAAVFSASIRRLRICPKLPAPKTPTCTDVCVIKDAICDNAEDICRIAAELPEDRWARDKCNSAKASCKEARGRCCGCISGEPESEDAGDGDQSLPEPL